MAKITLLPPAEGPASASCARMLRELLALAEAGELRALAIAYVAKGHEVTTGFERGDAFAALLGGATLLQHDLLHAGDVPGIDD